VQFLSLWWRRWWRRKPSRSPPPTVRLSGSSARSSTTGGGNRANIFCFLSSLLLFPLSQHGSFWLLPVISLLLTNHCIAGAVLPIHMIGEVSWKPKRRRAWASQYLIPRWVGCSCQADFRVGPYSRIISLSCDLRRVCITVYKRYCPGKGSSL
jgi:hypothetical protein